MRKVLKVIAICLLTVFSFYYTDKIIDLSRRNDPIMIKIKDYKNSNSIAPINGEITGDMLRVGKSGKIVDEKISYEKMKKIKSYNEELLEYVMVKPNIVKTDDYEKLITGVNTNDKEIAIVFVLDDINYVKQISYLLNNNINATFFMDGKFIENNLHDLKKVSNSNISYGIYSYNNIFNSSSIRYVKNLLEKKFYISNYCLYKNEVFLKSCAHLKINTIKPYLIDKNLYNSIKNRKINGTIYQIGVNENNIKELNSTLVYLNQKGYEIKSLNNILSE